MLRWRAAERRCSACDAGLRFHLDRGHRGGRQFGVAAGGAVQRTVAVPAPPRPRTPLIERVSTAGGRDRRRGFAAVLQGAGDGGDFRRFRRRRWRRSRTGPARAIRPTTWVLVPIAVGTVGSATASKAGPVPSAPGAPVLPCAPRAPIAPCARPGRTLARSCPGALLAGRAAGALQLLARLLRDFARGDRFLTDLVRADRVLRQLRRRVGGAAEGEEERQRGGEQCART